MKRHSAIEIQISVRVHLPRGYPMPPEDILREAVIRKAEDPEHEDPPGMTINIVRWRHGGKRGTWKSRAVEPWAEFARFLPHASLGIRATRTVRSR